MAAYPITLTPDDNGTFLITSEALPELTTFAETSEDAAIIAGRAVEEALAARMAAKQDLPPLHHVIPRGRPYAPLRSIVQMKITLYQRLRDLALSRAELARRLKWSRNSVDRLLHLDHQSRPDQLDAAFIALGWPSSIDAITGAFDRAEAA